MNNEIYLTDEEKRVIKLSLSRLAREYIRSLKKANTDALKAINNQKLVILASIERKLS